ncbi:MAG: hypothetical protein J5J00_00870 [Deltaproteobacteria bacterium]|nr:hypothetical protein [Deltaproteobacteria bacterium]
MSFEVHWEDRPSFLCKPMIELCRRLSLEERADRAVSLTNAARELMYEGMRLRNSFLQEKDLRRLFIEQNLKFYANQRRSDGE